jgi:hypothetical protein
MTDHRSQTRELTSRTCRARNIGGYDETTFLKWRRQAETESRHHSPIDQPWSSIMGTIFRLIYCYCCRARLGEIRRLVPAD